MNSTLTAHPWPVVLADLDGTLADSVPLITATYQHVFATMLGREVPDEQVRGLIGRTLRDVFTEECPSRADELESAYLAWNKAHHDEMLTGFDGIPQLCADVMASGIVFGVVTSKRREVALRSMVVAGLDPAVPLVGAMEDTLVHKPDPAPLTTALERLGRHADECVYVGDAVVDVLAAKAAGVDMIAVTWGAGERKELAAVAPTHLVDDVAQLRALLLG